ncbi:MAG: hypothetical protein ACRDWA_15110 [Acidimicrobiia bacterium]
MRRFLALVVGLAVIGCGEAPLAGVGGHSSDWIGEPTLATSETTAADGPSLSSVHRTEWWNGDLVPVGGTTPAEIIAGVYTRARSSDPYVQATPAEIAAALPGVEFPSQVPPEVRFITSQLVYDLSQLTLATDQVAAFGLWSVEPYTRSRSVGQQAVLTVVNDPEGLAAIASGMADTSCARYIDRQAQCSVVTVGEHPAWELANNLGLTLIWFSETYRYELFLRSGVNPSLASEMAESARPLSALSF